MHESDAGERVSGRCEVGGGTVCALGGGEAAAQLTPDSTFDGNGLKVDVASRVVEGASTTITVTLKARVDPNTPSPTTVTVSVMEVGHGIDGGTSEDDDVILNPETTTLAFPANTTSRAVTRQISGTILLQTIPDPDAEDETIVLEVSASGGLAISDEPKSRVTLDDDETQSYVSWRSPPARRPGRAWRSTWWFARSPPTWMTARP